jgi:hypothetical protein
VCVYILQTLYTGNPVQTRDTTRTVNTHTHTHTHTFGGVLEDQIHARLVIEVAVKTEDVVVPQVRLS